MSKTVRGSSHRSLPHLTVYLAVYLEDVNWVKRSREIIVAGQRRRGRPRRTWDEVVLSDLAVNGMDRALAQNRVEWKRVCHLEPSRVTHASMNI